MSERMVNASSLDMVRIETPGVGAVTCPGSVWLDFRQATSDLLAACATFVSCADEAWDHLDADRDMKCLKLLKAMAGKLPGYRSDIKAAHEAMDRAIGWKAAPDDR